MKLNSPQAEEKRSKARRLALLISESSILGIRPKWQAYGNESVIHDLYDELGSSVKREEQYLRIIKSLGKPPKPKKCEKCAARKRYALLVRPGGAKSKFRACNRPEALKIIDSVEECWPGFRRIPELLWNSYMDATAICRCGRPVAPKIVSKSVKAAHCCIEHGHRWAARLRGSRTKAKSDERKALAEAM